MAIGFVVCHCQWPSVDMHGHVVIALFLDAAFSLGDIPRVGAVLSFFCHD
jgi:hypothetical protein